MKVACLEEIAARLGYLTPSQLSQIAQHYKSSYGDYLKLIADELTAAPGVKAA
jgi:hypothetical protein